MNMHRLELQKIALSKLDDAELLFQSERYSNAYYLFGYAAEIALKARIAHRFTAETIPDKRFVQAVYSHDLDALVNLAGLRAELESARKTSPQFDSYWSTVSDWSEGARYDMIDVFNSTAMRDAMVDKKDGVFQWLQSFW